MKISMICFTLNGARLSKKLFICLESMGDEVKVYTIKTHAKEMEMQALNEPLPIWTKRQFDESEGIIFIGAAGIAVRAIAPFIKDKTKDPAVIVIDEKGNFVIPLLSGHIGGANELSKKIAGFFGSIPVITTATDINHKFAVDMFAKRNDLYISRMDYAKGISAAVLNDKEIGFECDFPVMGLLPDILSNQKENEYGICISLNEEKAPFEKTLNLIPRIISLGIGCRKGKTSDEIEKVVFEILRLNHISIKSLVNVASIDLKKDEEGLLKFCEKNDLKLTTYPAAVLEKVQGCYSESDYVKSITGIGNICERAAMLSSCHGTMIQKKYAKNGVTISIARKDWSVKF